MIVLTVPHSRCLASSPSGPVGGERTCDLVAEEFADALFADLRARPLEGVGIEIIKSHNNRHTELDDNRFLHPTTKKSIKVDSRLWRRLRMVLARVILADNLVLDIHSFPEREERTGRKIFDGKDVALLDNPPYQEVTIKLRDALERANLTVSIFPAKTGCNSILDVLTLHPIYTPVVLFELNEKYRQGPEVSRIASLVADFVIEWRGRSREPGPERGGERGPERGGERGPRYKFVTDIVL